MANVNPTFDAYTPMKIKGAFIVTGTIAVTNTAGESRLGKHINWCHMECSS